MCLSLLGRYGDVAPAIASVVLAQQNDLPDVMTVVVERAQQRVEHRVVLAPDGDRAPKVLAAQARRRREHSVPTGIPAGLDLRRSHRRRCELPLTYPNGRLSYNLQVLRVPLCHYL